MLWGMFFTATNKYKEITEFVITNSKKIVIYNL